MHKQTKVSGILSTDEIQKRVETILKSSLRKIILDGGDKGNGILFAEVFKDVLAYNTTRRAWLFFDGKAWIDDEEGLKAEECAQRLHGALKILVSKENDDFLKQVCALKDRPKRMKMCADAKTHMSIKEKALDSNPMLLNCLNGVYNLETHKFSEHKPDFYLSKIGNVNYNPDTKSALLDKFLDEITNGDKEKLKYLQMLLGYSLTGDSTRDEFYMLLGVSGRNGKSTLLGAFGYMLGTYCASANFETFTSKERHGDRPSEDIARLKGAHCVIVKEPEKRMPLNVSLVKALTGGDTITARLLYSKSFEFKAEFKLLFNTNYLPYVNDTTLFDTRRVKVIPFDRYFEEDEADFDLEEKLKTEENISALFNFCLDGLKEFQKAKKRMPLPESVKNAINDYRKESDIMFRFIDECLIKSESGNNIPRRILYPIFERWCHNKEIVPLGKVDFWEAIRRKHIPFKKSQYWNGQTERDVIQGYEIVEPLTRGDTWENE